MKVNFPVFLIIPAYYKYVVDFIDFIDQSGLTLVKIQALFCHKSLTFLEISKTLIQNTIWKYHTFLYFFGTISGIILFLSYQNTITFVHTIIPFSFLI